MFFFCCYGTPVPHMTSLRCVRKTNGICERWRCVYVCVCVCMLEALSHQQPHEDYWHVKD